MCRLPALTNRTTSRTYHIMLNVRARPARIVHYYDRSIATDGRTAPLTNCPNKRNIGVPNRRRNATGDSAAVDDGARFGESDLQQQQSHRQQRQSDQTAAMRLLPLLELLPSSTSPAATTATAADSCSAALSARVNGNNNAGAVRDVSLEANSTRKAIADGLYGPQPYS